MHLAAQRDAGTLQVDLDVRGLEFASREGDIAGKDIAFSLKAGATRSGTIVNSCRWDLRSMRIGLSGARHNSGAPGRNRTCI